MGDLLNARSEHEVTIRVDDSTQIFQEIYRGRMDENRLLWIRKPKNEVENRPRPYFASQPCHVTENDDHMSREKSILWKNEFVRFGLFGGFTRSISFKTAFNSFYSLLHFMNLETFTYLFSPRSPRWQSNYGMVHSKTKIDQNGIYPTESRSFLAYRFLSQIAQPKRIS